MGADRDRLITAVIATRGDVDLTRILETLPYDEIIVFRSQLGCFGRYLALRRARNETVYLQDDDLIFTRHANLLELHRPGRITANMPSPWYENAGYNFEQSVQVGAGSLLERDLPWPALQRYLEHWPADDDFHVYCDDIVGILTPSFRVDLGYEVLPVASAPNRIWTQPGAAERRRKVALRALTLRNLFSLTGEELRGCRA